MTPHTGSTPQESSTEDRPDLSEGERAPAESGSSHPRV